jgi:hypothetical protein
LLILEIGNAPAQVPSGSRGRHERHGLCLVITWGPLISGQKGRPLGRKAPAERRGKAGAPVALPRGSVRESPWVVYPIRSNSQTWPLRVP